MLVNYTPSDESIGVTKKISAQIRSFRKLGYEVYYSAYNEKGISIYDNNDHEAYYKCYPSKSKKINDLIRYFVLVNVSLEFIQTVNVKFDYCYGRLSAPNRRYLSLLEEFKKKGARVILESLSYFQGVHPKTIKSKYVVLCLNKNKKKFCGVVDKVVSEGEIGSFYGVFTQKGKIGIDTESLPVHSYNGNKDELNLISVATEREYHAYDRLIRSLANYLNNNGKCKIHIHLVGKIKDSTIDLIKKSHLNNYVTVYGRVCGKELYDIYAKCNIGVGPLGQHRVGGKKDTGLKTKEFFGLGLPYFYAGQEEDIAPNFPYILKVPSDESYINFDDIWSFYLSLRDNSNVAIEMREYANVIFSWDRIMQCALETH